MLGWAWLMLGCTGNGQQYGAVLDRAERQNLAYDSITGLDSLLLAVEYVDRHGSANEQVRAHYLLGCAYRDAGEAPLALQAWHDAADRADTARTDCDYGLLMRVHAQSAVVFRQQLLPYEMLAELAEQRKCALLAGDDLNAINALARSNDAYYLLNEPDSVIRICLRASALYDQYGYHEEAAQALGPAIDELVRKGDFTQAKRCMDRYATSEKFFKDGEPISRKALHYYSKGLYYIGIGKMDSAEVSFRKLLRRQEAGRSGQPQLLEAAYRGLSLLYREAGNTDSLAKYAGLLFEQAIPAEVAVNRQNIQQMQSLYNYTRSQREAERQAAMARQQRVLLVILALVVIILSLVAVGILKLQQWKRRRQQLEYENLLYQYHRERAELAKAKTDLQLAQGLLEVSDPIDKEMISELEQTISLHQQRFEDLERMLGMVVQRPQMAVSVNCPGNQIVNRQINSVGHTPSP